MNKNLDNLIFKESKCYFPIILFKKIFFSAPLEFFSFKAHFLAGNYFGFFWQPGVKGCLELLGFEPWTL